jgi:hypothetical protein
MKIAVIGSRTFNNYGFMWGVLQAFHQQYGIDLIISGGVHGADSLAEKYSKEELKREPLVYKADWDRHGKAAGMIRNKDIVTNSEAVIAFWDGKSRGTKGAIDMAEKQLKPVWVYTDW